MSENRFADCTTVEEVLRSILPIGPNPELWDALESDALARIRELQPPPTVSEEARDGWLAPAVELTPAELREAAALVEGFAELHRRTFKITESEQFPSSWPVPIMDAQLPVRVMCGDADWVLRIGGTDE